MIKKIERIEKQYSILMCEGQEYDDEAIDLIPEGNQKSSLSDTRLKPLHPSEAQRSLDLTFPHTRIPGSRYALSIEAVDLL